MHVRWRCLPSCERERRSCEWPPTMSRRLRQHDHDDVTTALPVERDDDGRGPGGGCMSQLIAPCAHEHTFTLYYNSTCTLDGLTALEGLLFAVLFGCEHGEARSRRVCSKCGSADAPALQHRSPHMCIAPAKSKACDAVPAVRRTPWRS